MMRAAPLAGPAGGRPRMSTAILSRWLPCHCARGHRVRVRTQPPWDPARLLCRTCGYLPVYPRAHRVANRRMWQQQESPAARMLANGRRARSTAGEWAGGYCCTGAHTASAPRQLSVVKHRCTIPRRTHPNSVIASTRPLPRGFFYGCPIHPRGLWVVLVLSSRPLEGCSHHRERPQMYPQRAPWQEHPPGGPSEPGQRPQGMRPGSSAPLPA